MTRLAYRQLLKQGALLRVSLAIRVEIRNWGRLMAFSMPYRLSIEIVQESFHNVLEAHA